jgi:hypothetical protein
MATGTFGFDLDKYLKDRKPAESRFPPSEVGAPGEFSMIDLPENELLIQGERTAQQFLSGELPDDVRQQVERIASERAVQGGTGLGQGGRNLVARDLGLTSVDLQQRGLQSAFQLGDVRARREGMQLESSVDKFEVTQSINQRYASLREEMRQWDDRFSVMVQEGDLNSDRMRLAVTDLISTNQRFMQGLINDLTIANSQQSINHLQSNIDDLTNFFYQTDQGIRQITGV